MAALMVSEPTQHAGFNRAAPPTLGHGGCVAGAEADLGHRALPLEVQRARSLIPKSRPLFDRLELDQRLTDRVSRRDAA
jgi:hypothetical protein